MKKFVKNLIAFTAICILVFGIIYIVGDIGADPSEREISVISNKVNDMRNCTTLFLGDSVCKQLLDPYQEKTDEICMAGNNASVTTYGNYFLLRDFIENNPQVESVYYFVRPYSLSMEFNTPYTFRFFVLPLYTEKHKAYLDSSTQALIESTFGKDYVNDGFMKTVIRKVPLFRGHYLKQFKETSQADLVHEITDWNMDALFKMKDICSERNIVFRVIPAPLADIEENYGWEKMQKQIVQNSLEEIMGNFVDKIVYYDSRCFRDGVHFTQEYLEENGKDIIMSCFSR